MKTKEELAKKFTEYLHKEVEEYYGRKCDPKDMYYRNGDISLAFESGWDTALKNQWTIPDCRDNVPDPKIVLKKGIIALLSNGRVIYQKDMRGFYWMQEDNKLVNYYSDVIAWMYAPSVDEFIKKNE